MDQNDPGLSKKGMFIIVVISFAHYDFEKKTNMESVLDEYVSEEDLKASFNDSLSP